MLGDLKGWLEMLADERDLVLDAARLAVRLFLHGFRSLNALEGLPNDVLDNVIEVPADAQHDAFGVFDQNALADVMYRYTLYARVLEHTHSIARTQAINTPRGIE